MKPIDKIEEEFLYKKKLRQGKGSFIIKKEIERDKKQVEKIMEQKRIKKTKLKKDPKEINKKFKEAFGNLA